MEKRIVFQTKQGVAFADEREAQLFEDIADAVDRYLATEDARLSGTELLDDSTPGNAEQAAEIAEIKAQMREQKLSGRKLAKKAGISPGMISEVLRGNVPLSENIKGKLVRALS